MKKFLALFLAIAMVFALVACSQQPAEEPADTTAPVESEAPVETPEEPAGPVLGSEPVEITFWHSASDDAGLLMDKYVADFNANNEYGITVNAIYQGQYSDATTLLKTILSAENYDELPDIMQMDATGKVTYFNSGKAFTVDQAVAAYGEEAILDEYLAAPLGNWQFSGAQLGLPFANSVHITYCNNDLLAQAGWDHAPDTFADVVKLYADMQAAGMTQKVFQNVPNSPSLANWLGQMGSYVVDNSNGSEATATELACLDNGALATFLTEWKAMYESGALLNENSSADAFIAGDVVLMVNSSSNIASVISKVDGAFEVGVSNYLRVNEDSDYGATVSGSCVVLFDSEDELRKAASWEFMKYLTGAAVQADFAAGTGYIPGHSGSLEADVYKAALETYPQMEVPFKQLSETPAMMRSITVGPSTDFYYAIMQWSSEMLAQDMTVEETVEIMGDELNNLLYEYNRNNG